MRVRGEVGRHLGALRRLRGLARGKGGGMVVSDERLFADYRELAHRFANRYHTLLEWDDLHAVADIGLLLASRSWDRRGEFGPYLYGKVVHEVVGEIRRKHGRRGQKHTVPLPDDERGQRPPYEEMLDISIGMKRLPERTQKMLAAVAVGCSLDEVGDAFGISGSRVCQLTAAARRKL